MSDSSALNLTLATAALAISRRFNYKIEDSTECLTYYTASLQEINQRLQDPKESASDGVVGTILGFACFDTNIGNWDRWKLHMSGLQKIIKVRGGLQSFLGLHILQTTILWVDVAGSLILDTVPRFELPQISSIEPELHHSPRILTFVQKWETQYPELVDIRDNLFSLASLARHANSSATSNNLSQDGTFICIRLHSVAHGFLCMSRDIQPAVAYSNYPGSAIREALRLTSILFIAMIKKHHGVVPSGVPECKLRLSQFLTQVAVDWSSFMDLHLWVLMIGALAEKNGRLWYVSEISATMREMGLIKWDDLLDVVKDIIWINEILDEDAEMLREEVIGSQLN
ncbi:hypothetical protein BT63DRAFT_138760 [Microthyrium microscopicum]|uniref:Uncharacterized protein n=1 Tax=Microthyrium microscopicum TaxID=703497 RepID=A0A6A6UN01_9PEZI|nr:hypothetical protein BT63DRAFT_138760 [Microthyrium microscopicum]